MDFFSLFDDFSNREEEVLDDLDVVLMAPGRVPNLEGLGVEKVGVKLNHKGTSLDDQLIGTIYNDFIDGRDGDDSLDGGSGKDKLKGRKGDDTLIGGAGQDKLKGAGGDDHIIGGYDSDKLVGGHGDDLFIYLKTADSGVESMDFIKDFGRGNDVIDLGAIDAIDDEGFPLSLLPPVNDAFTFIGTSAFSFTAGELRYFHSGGNTIVEGDTQGDGFADLRIELKGLHTLEEGDFVL